MEGSSELSMVEPDCRAVTLQRVTWVTCFKNFSSLFDLCLWIFSFVCHSFWTHGTGVRLLQKRGGFEGWVRGVVLRESALPADVTEAFDDDPCSGEVD